MNIADYDTYLKMTDRELLGFLSEGDQSTRKHAARHILELRRSERAARAAEASSSAARWSAVAAFLSVVVAIVALFWRRS